MRRNTVYLVLPRHYECPIYRRTLHRFCNDSNLIREYPFHVLCLVFIFFILVIINLEFYLFNAGNQASLYMPMGGGGGNASSTLAGLNERQYFLAVVHSQSVFS
jgi:hypothetical protein